MTVRERFEASEWLRWHPDAMLPGALDRDDEGGYYNTAVEYAWRVFQSAWLAAKADDAEICDRLCVSIVSGSFPALASAHASVVVATCAETIRDSAKVA